MVLVVLSKKGQFEANVKCREDACLLNPNREKKESGLIPEGLAYEVLKRQYALKIQDFVREKE